MKVGAMFPSQYLKAADVDGDTTLTIRGARMEDVKANDGTSENKPVLHFAEPVVGDTPAKLVLNKTNASMIVKVLGTDESSKWKGKQITLYVTEVQYGPDMVPAIRIRAAVAAGGANAPADEFNDDDIPF